MTARNAGAAALVLALAFGVGCQRSGCEVSVFCAAGVAPAFEALRPACLTETGLDLRVEASASLEAIRKFKDLGRDCDLLVLADPALVARELKGLCGFRLDFAEDEVVLAVGKQAPNPDLAERDWTRAVLAQGVRLFRADERLAPLGQRTLELWRAAGLRRHNALASQLEAAVARKSEDAATLAGQLKAGEADYGFLYRSTCLAFDLRYIQLGAESVHTAWTLTAPSRGKHPELVEKFLAWFFSRSPQELERWGFRAMIPPRYYGPGDKVFGFSVSKQGEIL